MSKKHHTPPVPLGNRSHSGPAYHGGEQQDEPQSQDGTGFHEEDPKRRLGDFTGAGEHARQQPGPLNDGGKKHGEDAG